MGSDHGELTAEQLQHASVRLSAGRIKAMQKAPYLSTALLALTPKARLGLGTFAVDGAWHMYYDPALCLQWTADEIAAVWLHEVNHVIRQHAQRFASASSSGTRDHAAWNKSADAAINSDLKENGVILPEPDSRYYADPRIHPDWKRGMTAEELYKSYIGKQGDAETLGGETADDEHGETENDAAPAESKEGAGQEDSNEANGKETGAETDEDKEAGEAGAAGEEGDSSSGEETDESAAGQGSDGEGDQDETGGDTGAEGSAGQSEPSDSEGSEGSAPDSGQEQGCGSAVDGIPRDYEEPAGEGSGLDEGQVDVVLKETARNIREHDANNPGSTPGGLVRAAEEILDPKVDWRRHLLVKVRQGLQQAAGKHDYSYTRPSRRYSTSEFVFPGMRGGYKPTVYVVLDTSGSMTPQDLRRALSEVEAMTRRLRGIVRVISCDASAAEIATVRSVANLELIGGGGTDMRVGIQVAAEAKPKADIILTITDGGTPWSKEPPAEARRAKYIALIVTAGSNSMRGSAADRKSVMSRVPDFMEAIEVDR